MNVLSDLAELSTLRTVLEDVTRRVEAVAERLAQTPDSAVTSELFSAERSLVSARRAIERASSTLSELPELA